jgi:hypothetical protein
MTAVPQSLNAVRCIVIPEDSRDAICEAYLSMSDGGLASLTLVVEGEPEEIPIYQRRDVVAFVNEAGMRSELPRNLRATRVLGRSLPPGHYVAGVLVLCGQRADMGIAELPSGVTIEAITHLAETGE